MPRTRDRGSYVPRRAAEKGAWINPFEGFRPFDAVLFGLFFLDRFAIAGLPLGVGLIVLTVALGLVRAPRLRIRTMLPLAVGYGALMVYLVILTANADLDPTAGYDWQQRALRIALLFGLIWALGTGRFHIRSAVIGLIVGLAINTVAYYLRLTPDHYPPFLTGWLMDKNVSGLWHAAVGMLGLMLCRTRWQTILWVAISFGVLFLTGSRTSLSGFVVGLIWWLARNRLPRPMRLGLVAMIVGVLQFIETNYARVGVFAERTGTDWFRDQLEVLMAAKVNATPWQGLGLTESWVWYSSTRRLLFHDSYAALYVEGGLPLLIFMVGLFVFVAGGLLTRRQATVTMRAVEAAIAAILVCAWKLGEVFFTSISFLVLGIALAAGRAVLRTPDPEQAPSSPEARASRLLLPERHG